MQVSIESSSEDVVKIYGNSMDFEVKISEISEADLTKLNDLINLNAVDYIEYMNCYSGLEVFILKNSLIVGTDIMDLDYNTLIQSEKDIIDSFVAMIMTYNS